MTKLKNIVVAAVSLIIFSNITSAQSVKAVYSVIAEEPLKVKYLGDDGEYLLFQVTFQSEYSGKGRFAIDDKYEGQLYSSVLATNSKVTTVKIEKTDADQVLDFKLFLGKKTYSKSFSVNLEIMRISPPLILLLIPCLIAFSTNVCNIMGGKG